MRRGLVLVLCALAGCVDPLPPIPTDGAARADRAEVTAPADAPTDTASDLAPEAATDAQADASTDIPTDIPADIPTDIPADIPTDIPADIPTDTDMDAGTDAGADVRITYTFVSAAFQTPPASAIQLRAQIAWHGTLRGAAAGITFEGSLR